MIPLFIIPIAVGVFAQFLKKFFNRRYLSNIKLQGVPLPRYGGMPSAHTAFAFSLLTLVYLVEGLDSIFFAMAVAATIFILDDALRMRIFLGRHGLALNRLIKRLPEAERVDFPHLERRLGHTPWEVLAGAALGVVGTYGLYWILL